MKAVNKPKRDLNKREKLEDVIPLDTPFSLFIEPSDKCNFRCKFCPTSNINLMKNTEGRNYGNMDFDLYKKIIDDLSGFKNKIKLLHLYKDGEPLLNPNIHKMIEYAKKSNCINIVSTTTNAYLLDESISLNIIESGLDRIHISIEGISEQQYLDISNVKIDFDRLIKNIEFFYKNKKQCQIFIKIFENNLTENDKNKFYKIFGNISDYIFIESIVPQWSDFEIMDINITTDKSYIGEKLEYRNVCSMAFYTLAVNSNGSVSPCCADWARKVIVGDVNNEKITDIWNGKKLRDLQILFLEGKRKEHPFCSSCGLPVYNITDNLDNHNKKLLERIKYEKRN